MAIRLNQVGNKAGKILATIRNAEASATLPKGTPVVLNLAYASSANDGLDVVLPATAGDPNSFALKYGVLTDNVVAGAFGESVLFGHCSFAIIRRATRAATSDSWSASATVASGIGLGIDTVNNCFVSAASIAGLIASNHMAAILVDSLATFSGSATATTDTRTAVTVGARVFVRML